MTAAPAAISVGRARRRQVLRRNLTAYAFLAPGFAEIGRAHV